MIQLAVETNDRLSQDWFVATTQMGFNAQQRKVETTSSIRIAAGLILGLSCFTVVLTGGIFVGQSIGEALTAVIPNQADGAVSITHAIRGLP